MTLSAIATLIVEIFLPETYQKYLFLNYKQSTQYRSYKSFVPEFLHGRPRSVIMHCLERRSKSLKYTQDDVCMISDDEGTFTVKGTNGNDHKVSFAKSSAETTPSCTCRDWVEWHIPCKHFFAIFRFYPAWNWASLPESYKTSAYLSTDTGALDTFFSDPPSEMDNNQLLLPEGDNTTPVQDEIPKQQVCMYTCILLKLSHLLISFIGQTLWKSLKQEGERARTTLKVLETMTYSCTSPQDLHELANKVETLITDFRAKLPKSEGIILRPEARKSVRKRAQQILKKYRPLPSRVRRGRQKSDWRHRNRFGQKASELRKVHMRLYLNVHDLSMHIYMYI